MASDGLNESKRRMAVAAGVAIEGIQAAGKQDRAEIQRMKTIAIEQVQAYGQQMQQAEKTLGVHRTELIRCLGEAAQMGNFAEMERLKKLLEDEKKE